MARRAPSSSVPGSVMRRSRSFWCSRMPLAKMRSIGPAFLAFWAALAYRSFRLVPDQNSRSKSSFSALTRLIATSLRKIAAQLAIETPSSISMTICTTQLACSTKVRMDIFCEFMKVVPEGGSGFLRGAAWRRPPSRCGCCPRSKGQRDGPPHALVSIALAGRLSRMRCRLFAAAR